MAVLGLLTFCTELLAQWRLPAPYPLVFALAFAPMRVSGPPAPHRTARSDVEGFGLGDGAATA